MKLETSGVAASFGFGGVLDKNSSHTRNARSSIPIADLSNKENEGEYKKGRTFPIFWLQDDIWQSCNHSLLLYADHDVLKIISKKDKLVL